MNDEKIEWTDQTERSMVVIMPHGIIVAVMKCERGVQLGNKWTIVIVLGYDRRSGNSKSLKSKWSGNERKSRSEDDNIGQDLTRRANVCDCTREEEREVVGFHVEVTWWRSMEAKIISITLMNGELNRHRSDRLVKSQINEQCGFWILTSTKFKFHLVVHNYYY